jgi:hypothetical protein
MNHREQTGPLKVNYQGHRGGYTIDNDNSTVEYAFVASRELAYALVKSYNAFDELLAALRLVAGAKIMSTAKSGDGVTYGRDRWTITQEAIDAVRAAIAKVQA